MKSIAVIIIFMLASCGVRKMEKQKLEQSNKASLETSSQEASKLNVVKTDNSKIETSTTDKSKVVETESTEVTADEADIDTKTGKVHLKGNVKVKSKKQKHTDTDKAGQTNIAKDVKDKTKASSNKADQLNKKDESKSEASGKKTEASASFLKYWWLWLIIIVVIIALIYFRKWRL